METKEACSHFLKHCKLERSLSLNSLRAYGNALRDFEDFLARTTTGGIPIEECGCQEIQSFLNHLRADRSMAQSSIKRKIACLKTLFKWLRRTSSLSSSPFDNLDLTLRLPRRLPRGVKTAHIQNILKTAATQLGIWEEWRYEVEKLSASLSSIDFQQLNTILIVELLFSTGIRVSELVAITLDDIDMERGMILIHGKGERERTVFLSDKELQGLLDAYIKRRQSKDNRHLLQNYIGTRTITQFVRRHLLKAASAASIKERVTPHMFRHACATNLLEAGVDIRFVQILLGHQSISTTEIYTHLSNVSLRAQLARANIRRTMLVGSDN